VAEKSRKAEFWTTLPGLLTGAGALITAIAGLILGLYQYGVLGSKQAMPGKPEAAAATGPGAEPSAPREAGGAAANPPAAAAGEQGSQQAMVTITAADGTVTPVFADSLREIRQVDKNLHLLSGQSVAFDRIRRIEVVAVYENSAKVRVILTNNQILDASLPAGSSTLGFHSENELGVYEIRMENLKQVAFPH